MSAVVLGLANRPLLPISPGRVMGVVVLGLANRRVCRIARRAPKLPLTPSVGRLPSYSSCHHAIMPPGHHAIISIMPSCHHHITTRATIKARHYFLEFRRSRRLRHHRHVLLNPKTDLEGKKKINCYRMNNPMPQVHNENGEEEMAYFRRFGVKEPRQSEDKIAKKRYTLYFYRSTRVTAGRFRKLENASLNYCYG